MKQTALAKAEEPAEELQRRPQWGGGDPLHRIITAEPCIPTSLLCDQGMEAASQTLPWLWSRSSKNQRVSIDGELSVRYQDDLHWSQEHSGIPYALKGALSLNNSAWIKWVQSDVTMPGKCGQRIKGTGEPLKGKPDVGNSNCRVAWTLASSTPNPTLSPTTSSPTSSPTSTCQSSMSNFSLTNANIFVARTAWFNDNLTATTTYGHISTWDTIAVTGMVGMFQGKNLFDEDIGCWNTAAVTTMAYMFRLASIFNQDLDKWDTGQVKTMDSAFAYALAFDKDIGGWNTAAVEDMTALFQGTSVFNQDIGSWNTAAVTKMHCTFQQAPAFDRDIGSWNTAAVTDMDWMFMSSGGGMGFNRAIGIWNTGQVTTMQYMFHSNEVFNKDIGSWNTAKVKTLKGMFYVAIAFNQDIGSWNTASVLNVENMLNGATLFNPNCPYVAALCPWGYTKADLGIVSTCSEIPNPC
jgi:surface protein